MSAADGIGSNSENVCRPALVSERAGKGDKVQEDATSLTLPVWLIWESNEGHNSDPEARAQLHRRNFECAWRVNSGRCSGDFAVS